MKKRGPYFRYTPGGETPPSTRTSRRMKVSEDISQVQQQLDTMDDVSDFNDDEEIPLNLDNFEVEFKEFDLENLEFNGIQSDEFLQQLVEESQILEKQKTNDDFPAILQNKPIIFNQLQEFLNAQELPNTVHKSQSLPKSNSNVLYSSNIICWIITLDSKISNFEAQLLINRMILEHKMDEVTQSHLLELINCFLPQGMIVDCQNNFKE